MEVDVSLKEIVCFPLEREFRSRSKATKHETSLLHHLTYPATLSHDVNFLWWLFNHLFSSSKFITLWSFSRNWLAPIASSEWPLDHSTVEQQSSPWGTAKMSSTSSPVSSLSAAPKPSSVTSTPSPSSHSAVTTKPSSSAGGASRKRKASEQLGSPASKSARSLKKCDRRVCDLVSASPFCFVKASEK